MANMKFPIHLIAKNDTRKSFREVESDSKRVGNQLKQLGSIIGGAFVVNEVRKMADEITDLRNRLTSFSGSAQVARDQIDLIEEVALKTRGTFEGTALAFSRMVQATQQMEISSEDLAKATATLNATFRLSGTSAYETTNSMRQLTQAFSSGRLSGDEMRSVLENNVVLANILASGFNTTVGGLREMGAAGKVVASDMFPILIEAFEDTTTKVDKMDFTIDNAFARLQIRAYQAVRDFDEATGASRKFASVVKTLSDNLLEVSIMIGTLMIPALLRLVPIVYTLTGAFIMAGAALVKAFPLATIGYIALGLIVAFENVRKFFYNKFIKLITVDIPTAFGEFRLAFLKILRGLKTAVNTLTTTFAKGLGQIPIFFEEMKVEVLGVMNEFAFKLLKNFEPVVGVFNKIQEMRGKPPIDIANLFGSVPAAQNRIQQMQKELDELQINLFDNEDLDAEIIRLRTLIDKVRGDFKEIGEDETFSLENLLFGTRTKAAADTEDSIEKTVNKTRELLNKIADEMKKFRDKQKSLAQELADIFNKGFDQLSQVITDFVTTGKSKLSDLINMITNELLNAMIMANIVNPLRTGFEGLFREKAPTPDTVFGTKPVSVFDGGGFTGFGSRSGGMDNKGGFPAILHPKETVIDHTKGQGGGSIVINQSVNFATGVQDTVKNEVLQLLPDIAETSKAAVVEAMNRGGNFRRGMR
jgi:tape measure domain-containing protein